MLDTLLVPQACRLPEVSNLRKRILKLRWIGHDEEAEDLLRELTELDDEATLLGGGETD